jgi:hypothetical protein
VTKPRRPKPFWRVLRAYPILSIGGFLALCAVVFFVSRLAMLLWTGGPAAWADRPVEGWMTPGFVIRVHDIPAPALAQVLGVDPGSLRGRPLSEIAAQQGLPLDALLAAIEALRVR